MLILSTLQVSAQSKIHGKVLGKDSKPLVNASVLLLLPKDSSLVKGTLTNEAGLYIFENIPAGNYLVSAAYTGYEPIYSALFEIANGNDKELALINLQPEKELDNVTVVAKKPVYEQKIDRLVINVASAINFTGINALDVLERSPGVRVNRVGASIGINGKSGVIVMINGKRNYMQMDALIQMLAGMPSGNIEKIEIITTPPANYDADGDAGIINIVLKSNNQFGTNGSFTLTAGYGKAGEQNSGSVNINHRKGKVNLFGNYSFTRYRLEQVWSQYRAVTSNNNLLENSLTDNRHALQSQHDAQAGMDIEVGKKTIIGSLLSFNYRHWTMESFNDAIISNNKIIDTTVDITNEELHTNLYFGANLNLQHTFRQDEKLTLNIDYLHYKDENPNSYDNRYYNSIQHFLFAERVKSNKNTPLGFWIGAADYSKKMGKKVDFEAGIKMTASQFRNIVSVATLDQNDWKSDTSLSGNNTLNENISAAYTSFNAKLSEKTSIKFGLRYEFTHSVLASETKGDIFSRNYGNLFPSFFLQHNIKENHSFNISYSRRIWRPGFYDLAPYVIFSDPKTFITGNPALQPSIMDAANATYMYKNKMVTISYSYDNHQIIQQPKVDENSNKMVTTAFNGRNAQNLSLSLAVPFNVTKWWNMQNNITGYIAKSSSFYKEEININSKGLYCNSSQTFLLPKDFSISISGYYNTGWVWGLYKSNPMGSLDMGIQKKFAKKKSSLTFNVVNILNSQRAVFFVNEPEQNLVVKNNNIFSYPSFTLSFSKSFGNEKVKEKRDRSTGAEDEKGRAY